MWFSYFDSAKINLIADIPLFIIITKELIRWKLPLFKVPAIMWILYLGLYWIPLAFLISIIEGLMAFYDPNIVFEKAVIHTLALGYFITVLIGFGTRVILGHSGSTPHANKFAIFIFVIQFVPALFAIIAGIGGSFGNADGSLILFVILTIISFIFSIRAFSSFDRMPGHKGVAGLIFGMVSMLIGDAVLLFQPVLDAWYYGAAFIIIASVLITLINVIRAFNVLTTRKLPQFATHKGGDDRA